MYNTMQPFNGDFVGSDGAVRNLIETGAAPNDNPKKSMTPFNGNFYASDGSVHNIDELFSAGGHAGMFSMSIVDNDLYITISDEGNVPFSIDENGYLVWDMD